MKRNTGTRLAALAGIAAGLAMAGAAHAQFVVVNNVPGTFIDISGTGTTLAFATFDDATAAFTSTVTNALVTNPNLYACTNGNISDNAGFTVWTNTALPAAGPTFGLFPFWDDLYLNSPGAVYVQSIVEGGINVQIVQWNQVMSYPCCTNPVGTFEVKIFGSGPTLVQFLYPDVAYAGASNGNSNGASATIGAQWSGGFAQYSYNTPSIQSGAVVSVVADGNGACCLPSGQCSVILHGSCASQGGIYRGDNSTCVGAGCPQPGACCLQDGSCSVIGAAACTVLGGTFGGGSTTCAGACPNAAVCYEVTGLSVPIFDSPGAGIPGPEADATLTITDSQIINGMSARIRVNHTFQGDLRVRLVHPDSTSVDLISRPGVAAPKFSNATTTGFPNDNLGGPGNADWMKFVDGAVGGVYDDAIGHPGPPPGGVAAGGVPNPTGIWQSEDGDSIVTSLGAAFNGKNINGTWHLIVSDHWPIDTGTIIGFGVCFVPQASACYANCDHSTTLPCLNVLDFTCFLNQFAAASTAANCDASTTPPVLNVLDFTCFLNKFAAGCSGC